MDMTEKHKTKEALQQGLALLRAVTEGTSNGIWVKDRDGRYIMINSAGARLLSRSASEVLGRTDADILPPGVAQQLRDDDLQVITEGKTGCLEYTLTENGLARTYLVSRSPFSDDQGQIIGVMGISHDITDRKRAEDALREREERYRAFIETTRDWIWACDGEGRFDYTNAAVEAILGYKADEVIGRVGFELILEDEREKAKALLLHCKQDKRGWTGWVVRCRHNKGPRRYLDCSGSPILDASGRVTGFRGVARDITERRQLEERLQQAQNLQAVGRLAGGVAHEFNNMLTVVLGYSDLALQTLGPKDISRPFFDAIARAGRRAAALTGQLLAFGRQRLLAPRVVDLNGIVNRAVTRLQNVLRRDIQLTTVLASALGPVKADPDQIEEVLITLVLNARDALPQGGRIIVETAAAVGELRHARANPVERPGASCVLAIHDTGAGMDEVAQAHAFEPFFPTKEVGKGTGMGLAAVHGLVQQNGGHIEVQSQPGQGTTFRVFLPFAADDEPLSELSRAPSAEVLRLLEERPPV